MLDGIRQRVVQIKPIKKDGLLPLYELVDAGAGGGAQSGSAPRLEGAPSEGDTRPHSGRAKHADQSGAAPGTARLDRAASSRARGCCIGNTPEACKNFCLMSNAAIWR